MGAYLFPEIAMGNIFHMKEIGLAHSKGIMDSSGEQYIAMSQRGMGLVAGIHAELLHASTARTMGIDAYPLVQDRADAARDLSRVTSLAWTGFTITVSTSAVTLGLTAASGGSLTPPLIALAGAVAGAAVSSFAPTLPTRFASYSALAGSIFIVGAAKPTASEY